MFMSLLDFLCLTILVTTPVAESSGSKSSTNFIPTHLNFGLEILCISTGGRLKYLCIFLDLGGKVNGRFGRCGITIGVLLLVTGVVAVNVAAGCVTIGTL